MSALAVLGIVLVSGTVVADVVLSFTANNGVGANASSPFVFENGGNYAGANGLGLVTNTYAAGTSGASVTTTISGIGGVPVESYNVTEFATSGTLGAKATPANVVVPSATTLAPTNVVCAYAFVSTAAPSLGTTAVAGAPAGCTATMPALGAVTSGCGSGATAQTAVVNLLTGAVTGSISTSGCTVARGTTTGTAVLYVSYAIFTSGAVTATTLNTFQVPITFS